MSPEEELQKWWKYKSLEELMELTPEQLWRAAYLLGHSQGMTRAAEIVGVEFELMKATEAAHYRMSDSMFVMESFGISREKAHFSKDMAEAILTERDRNDR